MYRKRERSPEKSPSHKMPGINLGFFSDGPNTEEGRRQRRFDSLSRLLSLSSQRSACTAVTIFEGELIIALNCADGKLPSDIARFAHQKLVVLRSILKNPKRSVDKLPENLLDAQTYFSSDIQELKDSGGLFQGGVETIAQALYKLIKSISGRDDPSLDTDAFSPDEINVLLNSTACKILVPVELDSILSSDMEFSYETASSPTDSSLTSVMDNSFSTASMKSPVARSSSFKFDSLDSSCATSRNSSGVKANSSMTGGSTNSSGFSQFWDEIDDSSNDVSASDFLSSSFNASCAFENKSNGSSSSNIDENTMYYAMNIYNIVNKEEKLSQQQEFPESIYKKENKPQNVAAFHAEQMIALYLKNVKKIDLNDSSAPPIAFGISKLCCAACRILYQFERIKLRGTSNNYFRGVPNIVSSSDSTEDPSEFSTPVKEKRTSTAMASPWS